MSTQLSASKSKPVIIGLGRPPVQLVCKEDLDEAFKQLDRERADIEIGHPAFCWECKELVFYRYSEGRAENHNCQGNKNV